MNKTLVKITQSLMNWCERRGRVLEITGTGSSEDVYLIRYYLVRSRFFNVFIHQFLRQDKDDLHDHPWDFVTYLVRGVYRENKWNPRTGEVNSILRQNHPYYKVNTFVFRKAEDQHQVVVFNDLKRGDRRFAPLTICVTGPMRREWGFWKERTPNGILEEFCPIDLHNGKVREFIDWRTYLGLPQDSKGRG